MRIARTFSQCYAVQRINTTFSLQHAYYINTFHQCSIKLFLHIYKSSAENPKSVAVYG